MPAHSRLTNGVASLAYVAGIHVFSRKKVEVVDAGTKGVHARLRRAMPGHDETKQT